MEKNNKLRSKALHGSFWATIEKFSIHFVNFSVGIVLARILGPKDFGLIALTTIFMAVCLAITDGGFEKILIQKKDPGDVEINTTFYLNIALGIIMALLIFATAPYIARFFNEPQLTGIFRVLAIILPLDALGQTQRTLLIKELNLKKNSYAQIAGSVTGSCVGLILAFQGFGVWALVYSSIISTLVKTIVFWIKSSWHPKLLFSYSSVSKNIPFGINVLAGSVLFFFLQQFNNFIVGKYFGKADLGLFNRGIKFPEVVIGIIQGVVIKMSFPLFAKLQDEIAQQKILLEKTVKVVAFITFPLLAFLFINAHDIILLLLTARWAGAIIYLQLFCLIKLFDPFININRELILAKGDSKLLLKVFVSISLLEVVPIIVFGKLGIMIIILISLLSKILQFVTYTVIASRKINLLWYESTRWLFPYLITTLVIAVVIYFLDYALLSDRTLLFKLIFKSVAGATLYLFTGFIFKLKEVSMILKYLSVATTKRAVNIQTKVTVV